MNFSNLLAVYISVGSLGLISIILSIINMFNLSSTASTFNQLQTDIDKKEKEFDTLKKAFAETNANSASVHHGQFKPSDNAEEIEVVRNVRSGYANTGEQPHMEQATVNTSTGAQDASESASTAQNSITIPLYSHSVKDADFNTLWQTMSESLEQNEGLHINIDFNNIMFLYEKEVGYLQKIYQTVVMKSGTLSFINCNSELDPILSSDPYLTTLIRR